jgi:pyruvyl transferase EpsO
MTPEMERTAELVRSNRDLTGGLAARAHSVLAQHVARGQRFALVDFPNHSNVGDNAIWLGELAALRAIGVGEPDPVW